MDVVPYLAAVSALAALALAFYYYKTVEKESPGNERMVFLMEEIQKGARAFLKKEYQWVSVFVLGMIVLLAVVITPLASVTYLFGAVLSATAGYAGMTVATMANARTTEAAKSGPGKALPVAFRGGAVMGFSVAGLALLGLMLTYLFFVVWMEVDQAFEIVTAYGLGASTIALFSRVGGGIYTKAADVGADLVGKVEAGIPEDDPRNPATIADNVGDNVGDVAGMGADLFESYVGSMIAPISLTAFALALTADQAGDSGVISLLVFPMAIAFVGMIASIIGSFFVKGGDSTDSHAPGPRAPHGHERRHGHHRRRHGRRGLLALLRRRVREPTRPRHLGHRRTRRRLGARQDRRVLHLRRLRTGQEDRPAGRDRPGHHDPRPASAPACSRSPHRSA